MDFKFNPFRKKENKDTKIENTIATNKSLTQEKKEVSSFKDAPVFVCASLGGKGYDSVYKDKEMEDFYNTLDSRDFRHGKIRMPMPWGTTETRRVNDSLGREALVIYLPAYDRAGRDSITAVVIGIPEGINTELFEKKLAEDVKEKASNSNLLELTEDNLRYNIENEFTELATYAKEQFKKYAKEK